MKNWSLQKKLVLQTLGTCILLIGIAAFGVFRLTEVANVYRETSQNQFPKVESASKMVAKFRQIRIQVRSLALVGTSQKFQSDYIQKTKDAISEFLEEKKLFDSFGYDSSEMVMVKKMNEGWNEFLAFGQDLLNQYENPTDDSLRRGAYMVREICPVKAKNWMDEAEKFLEYQSNMTKEKVQMAYSEEKNTIYSISVTLVVAFFIFSFVGWFYSRGLTNKITGIVQSLRNNSEEVYKSSDDMLNNSSKLSEAATEAASSLQETVSSIDEISSMIQRNADAASNSTQVSSKSSEAATRGKKTVESMMDSINDISQSNGEIADEMQRNNEEISKIVQVISEIGEKTKVINDIVFQTKLLSFNASVEAARAGEHGKGFAVVAEEVGNLASMSGKAALEITDMLDNSIKQVTDIVDNTKKKVEFLVSSSKEKVQTGTKTARECGDALDEILQNVTSVNEMVREIASASNEQSTGVQEVTKAMQQLDQTTHQNTSVAQESSSMAQSLKNQANGLNSAVHELMSLVSGSTETNFKGSTKITEMKANKNDKVIKLTRKNAQQGQEKSSGLKVAGLDTEIPSESDSRFEDL